MNTETNSTWAEAQNKGNYFKEPTPLQGEVISPKKRGELAAQHCPKCSYVQSPAPKCGVGGHKFYSATSKLEKFEASGYDSYDVELERWLASHGWALRKNLLSNEIEVRCVDGIRVMDDATLADMRFNFCNSNGSPSTKDAVSDAVNLIATRNSYHPVRNYLRSIKWDGIERLDTWLIDYAGADDTELNRAIGRKFLCAAVSRVRNPGCKFDAMLLLEGRQGVGKSTLCRSLCADKNWFSDQAKVGADPKETIEQTAGSWIVEMPELDGLSRREAGRVKSFITTQKDKARPAYGRYSVEVPRQFVLIGTTNDATFLTDMTGNRRWWIVSVSQCDPDGLADVRDQLWAEAAYKEPTEALWLDDPGARDAQEAIAGRYMDYGPWFELLSEKIPPDGDLKVRASDLWQMVGIDTLGINRLTPAMRANLSRALVGLGFDKDSKSLRDSGRAVRCYLRGDPSAARWWSPNDH